MRPPRKWVCSSAWLERTPDKGEVGSSSLPRPTIHCFFTSHLWESNLQWCQTTIRRKGSDKAVSLARPPACGMSAYAFTGFPVIVTYLRILPVVY